MQRRQTLKDHIRESRLFTTRTALASAVVVLMMLGLLGRFAYLQIWDHEHYSTLSDQNRLTILPLPPNRGLIYDRNGVLLARNTPSFSLEITPEQIDDLDATIAALGKVVEIGDDDRQRFKKLLRQRHPYEGIAIRTRLTEDEVARFAVNRQFFPGVDIQARLVREYVLGPVGAHVIGYVGRIDDKDLEEVDPSAYRGTTHIGKLGIEQSYEKLLHGAVGYRGAETTATGRVLRIVETRPPVSGSNIYLSIDIRLQQIAENALAGRRGAVVAIEPKSGDVLALASMPSFDTNLFVNGIDAKSYAQLRDSPDRPLYNRALRGQYPPGSTIKPFVGLAGLEYDRIDPQTGKYCPGWYSLRGSSHRYRDWRKEGHGGVDLTRAIVQSCDVYFYDLAHDLGIENLHRFMSQFGFGSPTGIDLRGERPGLMPSPTWKRAKRKEPWYPGETLIAGIGQGYVLATPLQLATATATLANHGVRMAPRVVRGIQPPGRKDMLVQPPKKTGGIVIKREKDWQAIVSAMEQVLHTPAGTAYGVGRDAPYLIAGKTGTAQVFTVKQTERYNEHAVAAHLRDHALFVAFAPADDPKIAVAVLVENGGHGGSAAAPVARKVMDYYLLGKVPEAPAAPASEEANDASD